MDKSFWVELNISPKAASDSFSKKFSTAVKLQSSSCFNFGLSSNTETRAPNLVKMCYRGLKWVTGGEYLSRLGPMIAGKTCDQGGTGRDFGTLDKLDPLFLK